MKDIVDRAMYPLMMIVKSIVQILRKIGLEFSIDFLIGQVLMVSIRFLLMGMNKIISRTIRHYWYLVTRSLEMLIQYLAIEFPQPF